MTNLAIVGLGFWGQKLVDAVYTASAQTRFSLAVVRRPEAVAAFAERRHVRVTASFAEALAAPDIDGVVLATPDSAHPAQVVEAARARKAVLVEKPFALDRRSAETAVAACRESQTLVAFAHNRRFLPAVRALHELVSSGSLGRLLHVEGNYSSNYGLRFQSGMWRASRSESIAGGMTGLGIHQIDLMILLAGKIARLHARGLRQVLTVDVEDNITMQLDFASGATGLFTTLITAAPMFRLRLLGSKGWAELIGEQRLLAGESHTTMRETYFPAENTEKLELEAFSDAIAGKAPYPVTIEDALHGVSVLESIAHSISAGRPVDVAA